MSKATASEATIETFEAGQRVRIKQDAFPLSIDPYLTATRGQTGTLTQCLCEASSPGHDALWEWAGDNGAIVCPLSSELEAI